MVTPLPDGDMHTILGDHGARITTVEKDIHEMKDDVREIRDVVVQAKGGWKLVVLVIAALGTAGSIGAGLVWLASHLK